MQDTVAAIYSGQKFVNLTAIPWLHMKALIVDDHKINRSLLKVLINDHFPTITTVDEAESVKASLELLENSNYDLIFLDIELKDGVGFDVLKEITEFVYVIVISSHRDYAIDAFKYNVVDYLLRPINITEFKNAVKKTLELHERTEAYKKLINDEQSNETGASQPEQKETTAVPDHLLINHKNGYIALPKKEIQYIQAQGKCSGIFTADGKEYISYKNLKEFELAFDGNFVRVHHSYLINVNFIRFYSREASTIKLLSGKEVPVSTRKKEELLKKFSIF